MYEVDCVESGSLGGLMDPIINQSLFYHSARQLHTYNIQKILSNTGLLRVNVRT